MVRDLEFLCSLFATPFTTKTAIFHFPQDYGMQRSRAWCGTPPILGVVNMVGTRNFTCYMGAL